MARKFLTPIDMAKNELQNAVAQNLASAPGSPVKGQFYMNSSDNILYWWDGTAWIPAKSGAPTLGAVTAEPTFGSASADGVASSVSRSDHKHGNPAHAFADHSAYRLDQWAVPTAPVNLNSQKIINLATPTLGTDGVNKDYVDGISAGIAWKDAVRAATTGNITLSAPQTIDGVSVIAGDRVLVKNQSTASGNGIYTVAAGAWVRATDADAGPELEGAAVFVSEGTTQADTVWVLTTNAPITPGTTALAFAQFGAAQTYSAGAGLTLTGNVFDVVALNGSIVVAADSVGVGYAGSGGDAGTSALPARGDHAHSGTYMRRFAQDFGGAGTSYVITHNLNSKDVLVQVFDNITPFAQYECDVEHTSLNTVTIKTAVQPPIDQYRAVVIG